MKNTACQTPTAMSAEPKSGPAMGPPDCATQQYLQLLFQSPDLAGQHRLRNVQGFGRAAEVQLLGHGHEVAQLTKVDVGHGFSRL